MKLDYFSFLEIIFGFHSCFACIRIRRPCCHFPFVCGACAFVRIVRRDRHTLFSTCPDCWFEPSRLDSVVCLHFAPAYPLLRRWITNKCAKIENGEKRKTQNENELNAAATQRFDVYARTGCGQIIKLHLIAIAHFADTLFCHCIYFFSRTFRACTAAVGARILHRIAYDEYCATPSPSVLRHSSAIHHREIQRKWEMTMDAINRFFLCLWSDAYRHETFHSHFSCCCRYCFGIWRRKPANKTNCHEWPGLTHSKYTQMLSGANLQ